MKPSWQNKDIQHLYQAVLINVLKCHKYCATSKFWIFEGKIPFKSLLYTSDVDAAGNDILSATSS